MSPTSMPTGPAAPARAGALDAARAQLVASLPEHFARLRWPADRLGRLRTERLRALLAVAAERSPFHARRLAGVDPSAFELADLPALPPMTKPEMMAAYDDVVTDRRITRAGVEAHLAGIAEAPRLYRDDFVVMASGGSSGTRGVFAYHHRAATEYLAAVLRPGLAAMAGALGWPPPAAVPVAIVAAPVGVHATRVLPLFLEGVLASVTYAPVTLPFDEIVARVQRCRPAVLSGYASTIARLADARAAGRLAAAPRVVVVTSEQLTDDLVGRIAAGFGAPPSNSFACSEGLIGGAPPGSPVFDFASDLAVVELVDADDRPVPEGATAHHALVTNLFNHTQPLIRYRLDDTMTPAPPAPGHGHQRATLSGRNDEHLEVGGTAVHPLTIRSLMVREPDIVDYQVTCDGSTLTADVVTTRDVDLRGLAGRIGDALVAAGAPRIAVTARDVPAVARDPRTGKARRFTST